jgi:hexosaminidase
MLSLSWQASAAHSTLQKALRLLAGHYPLREGSRGDLAVTFKKCTSANRRCTITIEDKKAVIEYFDVTAALRGIGRLLSEEKPPKREIIEETNFKTAGIMLDCSRNAVMKAEHFKGWLRKMALLGFNMAMLYTEDTCELPGEPYFGYQRGGYTTEELREIDDYATSLGIEMIGCIQTLAHLEQILKWSEYAAIKDTPQVMLIGEQKTYALIEKMIRHFAHQYRSRRIHIGMDEAEHFGRGRYMDLHGYKPSFDLFNEHLAKVVKLCKKYGLEPMLWSDMYFCMGSKSGTYYDTSCKIPGSVKAKIPKDARLVYWDYYHGDEAFYVDWIKRHRALGSEPLMASGIWTWYSLWYDRCLTEQNAGACMQACKKTGLNEIFFTLWGDDGAYCDFDSALAGMAYTSELMYCDNVSQETLARRFSAVCAGDYEAICLASTMNMYEDITLGDTSLGHSSSVFFWDDPLLSIYYRNRALQQPHYWPKMRTHYKKLIASLIKKTQKNSASEDLNHAILLAKILYQKIDICLQLETAYRSRRKEALKEVGRKIPTMTELLGEVDASFRQLWLARNKPQGLEVLQIRIAGLMRRYEELRQRIKELLAGKITVIDELEGKPTRPLTKVSGRYRDVATSSAIL